MPGEEYGGEVWSIFHPSRGFPLLMFGETPRLLEHRSNLGMWNGQKRGYCHSLGSVGPGKAVLTGTHELPNDTIWFTFFPSPK